MTKSNLGLNPEGSLPPFDFKDNHARCFSKKRETEIQYQRASLFVSKVNRLGDGMRVNRRANHMEVSSKKFSADLRCNPCSFFALLIGAAIGGRDKMKAHVDTPKVDQKKGPILGPL